MLTFAAPPRHWATTFKFGARVHMVVGKHIFRLRFLGDLFLNPFIGKVKGAAEPTTPARGARGRLAAKRAEAEISTGRSPTNFK